MTTRAPLALYRPPFACSRRSADMSVARRNRVELPYPIAAAGTPAPCGRLPAVTLLCDLDAFSTEQGRCGEMDGGLDGPTSG
jgi:hypothetical protein